MQQPLRPNIDRTDGKKTQSDMSRLEVLNVVNLPCVLLYNIRDLFEMGLRATNTKRQQVATAKAIKLLKL